MLPLAPAWPLQPPLDVQAGAPAFGEGGPLGTRAPTSGLVILDGSIFIELMSRRDYWHADEVALPSGSTSRCRILAHLLSTANRINQSEYGTSGQSIRRTSSATILTVVVNLVDATLRSESGDNAGELGGYPS